MQCYRRDIEAKYAHVLHNQCINVDAVQVADKLFGIAQLVVEKDCVDSCIHSGVVAVGKIHGTGNVVQ